MIINGAMQVAQRGTTGTSQSGNNNYVVDRFKVDILGSATVTHSQESVGAPAGFTKWLKLTPTVAEASLAATSYGTLSNKIEGYNFAHVNYGTADAQNVTVSFKFKTNKAGTYCMIHRNQGADRNYLHEFTPVADGNWQTITYTVPGDTTGTWNTTNSIGWRFELCIGNGTAYQSSTTGSWFSGTYFHSTPNQVNFLDNTSNELGITGVQVEVGDTTTSFEHRSYGDEELRCMRYYQRFGEAISNPAGQDDGFMTFANYTSTAAYGGQKFTVPMRGRPTMVAAGCAYYSRGATDNSINVDMVGASTNYGELRVTAISFVDGDAGWLRIEGSGAYIEFNAEL